MNRIKLYLIIFTCFLIALLAGCVTNVEESVLLSLTISPGAATLEQGQTLEFVAISKDQYGKDAVISPTWTVSNKIGTIKSQANNKALFAATTVGAGTVNVKVGNYTAKATVTVRPVPPKLTKIEVTPMEVTVYDKKTQVFTATCLDQFGKPMNLSPDWTVTGGIGTLSTIRGTTTTLTATLDTEAETEPSILNGTVTAAIGEISGIAQVTVREEPVITSIEITPTALDLMTTESVNLTAVVKDQYRESMDVAIKWAVTNQVGTIIPGTAPGTAQFTATTEGIGWISATAGTVNAGIPVTVRKHQVIKSFTIAPATATVLVGGTQTFTLNVIDELGESVVLDPTWTISGQVGTFVINADKTVTFTATKVGVGAIIATYRDFTASATITVNAAQ